MKKLLAISVMFALMLTTSASANPSQLNGTTLPDPLHSPMPLDGSWIVLAEVMSPGSFFTGIDGFWEWTSSETVYFTITDLYVVSDQFEVYDDGALVLTTPSMPDYDDLGLGPFDSPPYTTDPDVALTRPEFSSGTIAFAPGYHKITISAIHIPPGFADATVAFRAVIPAPGAILLGSIGVALVGWLRRRRTL